MKNGAQKVVAWARPVYARPVNAPESAEEWDELVDIEFYNRAEKPEGEGWRPLVVADTGDGAIAPLPRINIKCETVDNGIAGVAFLNVIRVEQEDDGSLTAVIDHWPRQAVHCDNCGCDWLDNGLNPVGCPYCKQFAETEALRAEVERLNRILGRIVEGDGDSTTTIRAGTDAFAAAREYLRRNCAALAEENSND